MATTTTFLSVPLQFLPPKQLPNSITSNNKWSQTCLPKSPFNLRCTSSPSTSTVLEDEGSLAQSESDPLRGSDPLLPFSGCKACGKEEIEKGCNGEGRIQGGIATVPGFGWWPIKAYRPCPEFVATGGRYRRQGQSMDEVAGFGRVEKKEASVGPGEEAQSSKKKQGMKKFKR